MNNNSSRSSLFLMELILTILIFCICSAICVQMFVKSHVLSNESVDINNAVILCKSVAESFYATDGDLKLMAEYLDNAKIDSDMSKITVISDKGLTAQGCISYDGDIIILTITCYDSSTGSQVYSLAPELYPSKSIKENPS